MKPKFYIYLIGFLVIIAIGLGVYFAVKPKKSEYDKDIVNDELSYSDSEYRTFALGLKTAMVRFGTDEESIYRIIAKCKTISDWNKLVSVYNSVDEDMDLVSRLHDDLDSKELAKVNSILSNINVSV